MLKDLKWMKFNSLPQHGNIEFTNSKDFITGNAIPYNPCSFKFNYLFTSLATTASLLKHSSFSPCHCN